MSIRAFELPDLGEGIGEGELVRWLVEPGDPVSEDQSVAEVETDKALVEIPAPVDGRVDELRADPGDVVPVGEVLLTFEVEADDGAPDAEPADAAAADEATGGAATDDVGRAVGATPRGGRVFAAPSARRLARELGVDVSAVTGSGPGGRVTEADVRAAGESSAEETARLDESAGEKSGRAGDEAAGRDGAASPAPAGRDRTLAAPATRRLAAEADVDLGDVPTDETRDGRAFVTPEAVRDYAEARRTADAGRAAGATAEPEATDDAEAGERVPYRGVRRAVGERMERSAYTAPHATHHDSVDAGALVDLRTELKPLAAEEGVRLTYLPFVMKAVVAALQEFPYMNASLDEEAEEIALHEAYHVGVATATDAGLVVPVVRDVDRKGFLALAEEVATLADRARERSLSPDEMRGGTFTLTNFGAVGGEYATPIINYPEVAVLGLGAIAERPRVVDGEVVPRHVLPLSLSIDHRVVDGATAAAFTNRLKELLERPNRLLLE